MALQLKAIERTDRATGRLNAALGIYRETILPEAQNPEKQILYWIAHSNDKLSDEFRCFAIQDNNKVIGYLQYSFFNEENIIFFEYLCLKGVTQAGLVPSHAIKEIENYLVSNYRAGFSIVFEVARKRANKDEWKSDVRLVRYFERLGFRTIEFDYRYPALQTYDGPMSYPADLMIRLPDNRKVVSATELRTVLRCLYFRHYLRWDRPFLEKDRFSERERLINELYNAQTSRIGPGGRFGTKGDDNRSGLVRLEQMGPQIGKISAKLFGPKFFRVAVALAAVTVLEHLQSSDWLLIPDCLLGLMLFSASEDTPEARKLLIALAGKITAFRLRR